MANPFDDDYDNKTKRNGLGLDPVKSYMTSNAGSIEDQITDYEKEIEKYMQSSLDSTQRSCQQLDSSEQLAENASRDLLEQREKLERTERNLDEIHHTTRLTQRSLNSLKSVFGGFFKNKFSRAPKEKLPPLDEQADTLPTSKSEEQFGKVMSKVNATNRNHSNASGASAPTLSASSRAHIKDTRWEAMDDEIDQNLGNMSAQLARLRTWGTSLGDEVDDQNKLLDRIHTKAERNDGIVRGQDAQMRKMLG